MRFANATALAGSAGDYTGRIVDGWDIGGIANGGYMMAMLARAALATSGRPDVVTLSADFLSPGRTGPVTARTVELKSGRMLSSIRVELIGGDKPIMAGTVQSGDLSALEGPSIVTGTPSDIPPPDQCIRALPGEVFPPPLTANVDLRVHPDDGFTNPDATPLTMRSWFRLLDGEAMDTIVAVLATDVSPPTIFNSPLQPGWMPTVQMTVHVRRRPDTTWLFADTCTRYVTDGLLEIDCNLWNESGAIVAQSRQLALAPRQP
ncbi:MAG: thioesterase family protein [Acidimicrobiales bacterium]